jgi:hypothetical protein
MRFKDYRKVAESQISLGAREGKQLVKTGASLVLSDSRHQVRAIVHMGLVLAMLHTLLLLSDIIEGLDQ